MDQINHNFISIFNDILLDIDIDNTKEISNHLNSLNGNSLWKLFEYGTCISENVIPWDLLSFDHKEKLSKLSIYRDFGIDGISDDFSTSLQCKYRDNTNIKWTEIANFDSLSRIIKCKKLLLNILDTSKYPKLVDNIENLTIDRISKKEFIDDLVQFVIDYKIHFKKLREKIKEEKEYKLRYYQFDAFNIFKERLNEFNFTNLQLTCGSGKSLIIKEVIKYYYNISEKNIILLIPSIQLCYNMNQLLKEFDPIVYTDKKMEEHKTKLYLCVYNSIAKLKDIEFGLKIIDEGHHLDTEVKLESYRKIIQKLKVDHTLSLSATFHKETELHYKYSLEQGVKDGFINDYDIIVPFFKNPEELDEKLNKNEEEIKQTKSKKYNDKLEILKPYIYKSYLNLIRNRIDFTKILVYNNSIEESKAFVKFLNENGITSVHIDGDMSLKQRNEILKDFEFKYRVVSSVNVLGEGIDIPYVNTCIFLAPRYSFIGINQCIGRILRKKNMISHIVLPHIIENDMLEEFINIMSENDSRLKDKNGNLSKIRIVLQQTLICDDKLFENNMLDIYYEKFDNLQKLKQSIIDKKIEKYKEWVLSNDRMPKNSFDKEEKYVYTSGLRFRSMKRGTYTGTGIKILTKEQIDKLDELVKLKYFYWEVDDPFMKNYENYYEYVIKNGIPRQLKHKNKTAEEKIESNLAYWMSSVKKIKKAMDKNEKYNNRSPLSEKQIEMINELVKQGYWEWEQKNPFMTKYIAYKNWSETNPKKPRLIRKENRKTKKDDLENSLAHWFKDMKRVMVAIDNNTKLPGRMRRLESKEIELLKGLKYW